MAADIPLFTLNDGTKIPSVGMGCFMGEIGGGQRVYQMCMNALKCGYRHFDTAFGYGNEEWVGRAIRESGIPREEVYLTTKLPNHHHHKVRESFEESLAALNCGYIDLYLMHWPQAVAEHDVDWPNFRLTGKAVAPNEHPTFIDTYKEMEKLLEAGKVKSIGVSNFSIKTLNELLPHCKFVPATNQVELHPCLPQHELKTFCESKGILLTAYSPLGRPMTDGTPPIFFRHETILSVAEKKNATPAQVVVSWGVQRGTVVVPKSENVERMKQNITLVKLLDEDMDAINNLHKQPGMHRSLLAYHNIDPGNMMGWTYADMGWDNMKPGGIISPVNCRPIACHDKRFPFLVFHLQTRLPPFSAKDIKMQNQSLEEMMLRAGAMGIAASWDKGQGRPLEMLIKTKGSVKGVEAQRLRTYATSQSMEPNRDLDPYGQALFMGDLDKVKADFEKRVARHKAKDRTEDKARMAALDELYAMHWGPTKVPIYDLLLLATLILPGLRLRHLAVAGWLVYEAKVPVDGTDLTGTTTLAHCISTKPAFDPEFAQLLYDAGADINHQNRYGDVAANEICTVWDRRNVPRAAEALTWFLSHGGNVDIKENEGLTCGRQLLTTATKKWRVGTLTKIVEEEDERRKRRNQSQADPSSSNWLSSNPAALSASTLLCDIFLFVFVAAEEMDSLTIVTFSTSSSTEETSMTYPPMDEESAGTGGFSYCVIA
ncbi:hypothetical protein GLOTRDRAFT_130332 [Gloeophyllum trabeum ATCC 11539]|uniref:NADP-dependent oxidoreductase domain-containing protein n=1 Tax=Gloeophyllum trabeum (strain ATCC 11539 / FP-39264 / Madison 617) TaxID=670483 RepID=S7Q370_GLOTA|nr:uncharacterized protein GLOTRDRAFT_130332 [Gloeophyllum trabeum ATCC 11539]EPQ53933.1 hypothetical protein GLOTRDRAFT_130332 [Gloeophyllum trabeum ATCC 11539]